MARLKGPIRFWAVVLVSEIHGNIVTGTIVTRLIKISTHNGCAKTCHTRTHSMEYFGSNLRLFGQIKVKMKRCRRKVGNATCWAPEFCTTEE